MRSPQRVVWSEGMLLSPQHLQALDRFHEAYADARVGAVAQVPWGVVALELDEAALAAGQVRLLRFAGILPDGMPVAFDEPAAAPPLREVATRFAATARSLDVYLAVPREREGVSIVDDEGAATSTRYLATTRPVRDATSPDATQPVRFARANAVILLGDEPREDHESMKVAEVVRGPGGQLALAEWYVPPCLRLAASPRLIAAAREVLTRAIAKQRQLAETRRHREGASDITAPDVVRLLQLLVVSGAIPALAHAVEADDASPRECYLLLAQLAGQLSTFRGEDPTGVPKFQHTDLRATFQPLAARVLELLGAMGAQEYLTIPLDQRAGGLFVAKLQEERLLRGQLFLTVKSDQPESTVVDQLPRLCKIASASEIQALVQAAAPGLPLRVVHRPPPQLPIRPGVVYFSLVPGDRFWQGIVNSRNLTLYLPPPFDPARTKLELLAIPAEHAAGAPPARP